ncbi:MAG: FMN-binding negative transcriptional regulator [Candidatus Dormibacteraeota bacterium]|nr:FMN-binding negative transcriptional regulator [Candidatus Dormibacteraeota bacterium]
MFESTLYPTDPAQVDSFVAEMRHGTLIATPPGGHPSTTMLPFVRRDGELEVHCVQADPTFAALQAEPRVTFLVSDFLAFTPHDFVDPVDAGRATLNFRAVAFECDATWSTDPAAVAAALNRLLLAYEPAGAYAPPIPGPRYGPRLARLAALRLRIVAVRAKFKVGPAVPAPRKLEVTARLRGRGEPGDARAADVIERYLESGES